MVNIDFNTIYVNGDSWSAGDIVDPELFPDQPWHVNHPDNKAYRTARVWPRFLSDSLDLDVINNSHAGASNDRIVRSTVNEITGLLRTFAPSEIFVLIGWSSPERKDFYYDNKKNQSAWDTVYPAEFRHWEDEQDPIRNDFYKNYVAGYWNEEEYLTRHILNVTFLSSFLDNLGIKYKFFDCFYEEYSMIVDPEVHQLLHDKKVATQIEKFKEKYSSGKLKHLGIENSIDLYLELYHKHYIKKTFAGYLNEIINEKGKQYQHDYIDFHPTLLGHQVWANYLANNVFKQI